ncbi:MAG: hypothetical protein [Wendovervirus sonii]|uniref:Uncharacterized protein n=1 Tax=phage Lak_Megaphage_Sonny TaxID=3109229 RepID=A0ABZ0Z529_9CAUD|nr:MAG: hypothetical protein [phage Lak_Megaphage_Sonny]
METKEDKQYQEYLTNHIANVQKGFQWLIDKHIVKDDNGTLRKQIEQHDQSKYSEDEWNAYRDYFYANGDETAFNKAWLHHIHNNPHHWQHWVLINDDGKMENASKTICIQIPKNYIVEMVCDWWAFSWGKNNLTEISNWYNKNKDNMLLHEQSRKNIESLLAIIMSKL